MRRSRTQSAALSLCCSVCNQNFGRQEHLTRHLRIHTREKPFRCSICNKRFSRLRHTAAHEEQNAALASPVSSRACKQCANDRVRCSRGQPCKRCSERALTCWYPSTETSTSQTRQDNTQSQAIQDVENDLNQGSNGYSECGVESQTSPTANDRVTNPGMEDPMAWPNTFSNIPTLYDCDQPNLGLLGVNWISPQYHDEFNWDALMDGLAVYPRPQDLDREQPGVTALSNQIFAAPHLQQTLPDTFLLSAPEASGIVNSAVSPPSSEGRYYVDGHGARAPFGGRIHDYHSPSVVQETQQANIDEINSPGVVLSSTAFDFCLPEAYENLTRAAISENDRHQLCLDIAGFPSLSQVKLYVRSYFAKFHPIFPFLRKASFVKDHATEWLLLLAVAVVGSRYVHRSQGTDSGQTMFRLLTATLTNNKYGYSTDCGDGMDGANFVPGQQTHLDTTPSIQTLQAGVLNIMCLLHSGKEQFIRRALVERHYLAEACHSQGLISRSTATTTRGSEAREGQHFSLQWLLSETKTRLGMMIWFLDSMILYEFDAKPLIDHDDINATLPSHEDMWENPNLAKAGREDFPALTFTDAMETIYMEKRLPCELSDFSTSLLVNGIYRNTKKIMLRESNRLSLWTPSATAHPRSEIEQLPTEPTYLPATSTASKWRNSACDCLDVLHWPANSKAAQSFGSEQHTILHLHLARVIVLTPVTYIQTLASTIAFQSRYREDPETRSRFSIARNQVLQWVIRDRCKARLCIVHCGALYWHIRRYSCDSVLEPFAIFVATLVLWVFSSSLQLPEVAEAVSENGEDAPEPSFLHLDRPIDDELVQTFVRVGHKVSAHISKVGNILDANAPTKILQEGILLLSGGSRITTAGVSRSLPLPATSRFVWGIEESYSKLLSDLLDATVETPGVSIL